MKTNKGTGRLIGALLFAQLAGLFVAFSSMMPALSPDYLAQAAAQETVIRTAGILLILNAAIALGIGIAAFPVFRANSVRSAIWLVAIGAVWLAVQLVDSGHVLSMLSLSKRSAEAAAANADIYNIVGAQVRSTRTFIHYGVLLTIDIWFGLFYGALFAFRLVPRWLGVLGVLAVVVHTIGISLSAFIGYPIMWSLAYPFALAYLVFGGWLIVNGFAERRADG